MRMSLKSLLLLGALALSAVTIAPAAFGAEACPNEQLREENNSLKLPDCRAYELVTTDTNHIAFANGASEATPDGNTIMYDSYDAPDDARSALAVNNYIRARRDPVLGWSDTSLAPPLPIPAGTFQGNHLEAPSEDLSSLAVYSNQPLSGENVPSGQNLFVEQADGSFSLTTRVGSPYSPLFKDYNACCFIGGTPDYSHVYFTSDQSQLPPDPGGGGVVYVWSREHGLRLLGLLPGEELPTAGEGLLGGVLPPESADGDDVLFFSGSELYLRIDESETVDLAPVLVTPGRSDLTDLGGVTADGSKVFFTNHAQLTSDANTGVGEAGRDLYSFDTATRQITDLTVDTDPADTATGANVKRVVGATRDGSYIYFVATGHLAEGALSGGPSLYLWHNGQITFIASAEGLVKLHVTPNGQHAAFTSSARLTAYDNNGENEAYETTIGSSLVCVSCRPDGTQPTGASSIGEGRAVSDDGSVFFESTDALVPGASGGVSRVFEYASGAIVPISPVGSTTRSRFVDASESGRDVFFQTFAAVIPNPNSGDAAIYDARVNGGFAVPARRGCEGPACQGEPSVSPPLPAPSTSTFSGSGNLSSTLAPAKAPSKSPSRAEKLAKALRACASKPARERSRCRAQARKRYGVRVATKHVTNGRRAK